MFINKKLGLAVVGVALMAVLSGCSGANGADQTATNNQLEQYQKTQPMPFFDWSQYRQTLISVETAQAKGTATTSFFFVMGVAKPIKVCDSVGYPVATTSQMSNPLQAVGNGAVIGQMEPTGVFTGDSSGTYVVCIIKGKAVPTYWEGFVHTEGAPAKWDDSLQQIVNTGDPTVTVDTKK